MSEPTIYIPSYQRDTLRTLTSMAGTKALERVALVVHPDEVERYAHHGVQIIPCPVQGDLGTVRQWLMDRHYGESPYMIQMDDDLRFAVRRMDNPNKFRLPEGPWEVDQMFDRVFELLDAVPLVGVRQRGGANRSDVPFEIATRQCMLHGLNVHLARAMDWEYKPIVFEDFDYTLQVLTSGYQNAVLTTHVIDQSASQAPGGVGEYRDNSRMERDALDLALAYPDFVRIKRKKGWAGMEYRTDVNVQWKQALKSSGSTIRLDPNKYLDRWWSELI
jgi:hypothetical protein